jgi:hypothetical protein
VVFYTSILDEATDTFDIPALPEAPLIEPAVNIQLPERKEIDIQTEELEVTPPPPPPILRIVLKGIDFVYIFLFYQSLTLPYCIRYYR